MFLQQRSANRLVAAVCVPVVCLITIYGPNAKGDAPRGPANPGGQQNRARSVDNPPSAARLGELETLKEFVARDPSVLKQPSGPEFTLLHQAAVGNQPEVIEYLVEKGLAVDARDATGGTPLHYAASRGSLAAAKALVRLGADPTARKQMPQPKSSPSMSVLSAAALGGHPAVVEFLLEQGAPIVYGEADWKKEGSPKETALHWAMMGHTEWTDPRHSADPEYVLTQQADRLAVVDILARRIGDINTKATGAFNKRTPLHLAAAHHHPPVVRYLLENYPDIDVDAKDLFNKTPMGLARAARPVDDPFAVQRSREVREVVRLLADFRRKRDQAQPQTADGGAPGEIRGKESIEAVKPPHD